MTRTLAAIVLLATVAIGSSARAYVRATVDGRPETPLFWRYRVVLVQPADDTSVDVAPVDLRAAILRSIDTWNAAAETCSDFRFEDGGYPNGLETNLSSGTHDGENRIVWREDEWPDDVPLATLAITTFVYRVASGEILDADVDVNGVAHVYSDTVTLGLVRTDVENTITHELGHVLGLAHSPDPEATMYRESAPQDLEKRSLAADAIDGLCFIYPDGVPTPDAPILHAPPLTGCSIASAPSTSALWSIVVVTLLVRRKRAAP